MSGVRLHNRRQGDRSEYLAIYMLSALGLVTQVPRQEDIGFDLICNISDQEGGLLSFQNHYAVSVKSTADDSRIVLEPPASKKKLDDPNYEDHFKWLFNLELPLMLGLIDKKLQKLSLYSTLSAWFLHYERRSECGIIELVPRVEDNGANPLVDRPKDLGAAIGTGGRKHFEVDLGFPVAVVSTGDLHDPTRLREIKAKLRFAIEFGAATARFALMHTPVFWWQRKTIPDGGIQEIAFGVQPGVIDAAKLPRMMAGLAPGLMSAALLFKRANQPKLLQSLREVMLLLPPGSVPKEIQNELPEVYGNQPLIV